MRRALPDPQHVIVLPTRRLTTAQRHSYSLLLQHGQGLPASHQGLRQIGSHRL